MATLKEILELIKSMFAESNVPDTKANRLVFLAKAKEYMDALYPSGPDKADLILSISIEIFVLEHGYPSTVK